MSVLVVAAHPDDEVLGCGATVARLVAEGEEVAILILGEGGTARLDRRDDAAPGLVDELAALARSAGAVLGVSSVMFGGLPDNRFDSLDLLDVVHLVERHIGDVEPSTVMTHHPRDLNIDHQCTAAAVITATRPLPGSRVREVLAFEVLSATEWSFDRSQPFRPNVFVNIAEHLDTKLAALAVYDQEMRAFPHPRSIEAVRSLAALRGSTAGLRSAEAFELLRQVR